MRRELTTLIPGQRSGQVHRQRLDLLAQRLDDALGGAIPPELGEHHVPGMALYQRHDLRAAVSAEEQIALPMAGHGAILDLRRALRDRDHVRDPPTPLHPPTGFAL